MTKSETVKNLNDTGPQLQIVRAITQMQHEMQELPSAIAAETSKALEPLATLQTDVQRILAAYDTVLANQRQTLDELATEMADRATAALQSQTTSLSQQVSQLQTNIRDIQKTMDHIARLPSDLANSYHNATTATERLISEADRLKPRPWKTAATLVLAGMIGGAVALAGTAALNRHLPESGMHNGAWAQRLWHNATPAQQRALTEIASEPEK